MVEMLSCGLDMCTESGNGFTKFVEISVQKAGECLHMIKYMAMGATQMDAPLWYERNE